MMADTQQEGRHITKGFSNTRSGPSRRLADSDLRLCTAYLYAKDGCSRGDTCNFLHICRYFMLRCCRGGKNCKFSHDLSTRGTQDWFQRRWGINRVQGENLHKFRELFGETLKNPPKNAAGDESFKADWEEKKQRSLQTLRQFLISLSEAEGTASGGTSKDVDGDVSKSTRAKSSNEARSTHQQDDRSKTKGGRKAQADRSSKPPLQDAKRTQETQGASTITSSDPKDLSTISSNPKSLQERCPLICLYYLRGTCSYTEQKHKDFRHFPNSFQWQIRDGDRGIWLDLTEETNLKVEQHFCDVTNGEYDGQLLAYYGENKENILHLRTVTITFGVDTLTISDKSGQLVDVRRLSSMSYAQAGGWIKEYSTHWTWYWQNDRNNWIEYPHKKPEEGNSTPSTKNETIEKKYIAFKHKGEASKMMVTTDQGKWCLDFAQMKQTSSGSGADHFQPVARRPKWKPSPKQQPHGDSSSCNLEAGSSKVSSPVKPVESAPQQPKPVTLPTPVTQPAKKDVPAEIKEPAKKDVAAPMKEPAKEDIEQLIAHQLNMLLEVSKKHQVSGAAAAAIPKQTTSKLLNQEEPQRPDPACQIASVIPSDVSEASLLSSLSCKASTKDSGARILNQKDCLDICPHFLKGSCKIKDGECKHGRHIPTPYQWQYQKKTDLGTEWNSYGPSANNDLEKDFCDVSSDAFKQSVPACSPQKTHSVEWIWYWQDERDQWIAYSDKSAKGDRAGINSAIIEKNYRAHRWGSGESFIEFTAGQQNYKLDFVAMHQTNVKYRTCRKVRRESKVVAKEDQQRFSSYKSLEYQHVCGGTMRRLSTASSVLVSNWERAFSNEWIWYWQDELDQWIPYSDKSHKGDRAGINSTAIEKKFLDYVEKQGESFIEFTAGKFKYMLDFVAMHQTNLHIGTCRKVRRRPTFVPMAERQKLSSKLFEAEQLAKKLGVSIPVTWENVGAQKELELVALNDKGSEEYTDIATLFEDTMSDKASIVTIRRVQNMELWEDFTRMSERMKKKNGGIPVQQKRLFHGTPARDKAHAICRQNFDWRLNGSNVGALYGRGSYFAHDADLAHGYTKANEHGYHYLLIAQVLVGAYTTGSSSYVRPPPKDPLKPHGDMFDSCVDSTSNPKKFVIFEKTQAYPEYLIKYKDKSRSTDSFIQKMMGKYYSSGI